MYWLESPHLTPHEKIFKCLCKTWKKKMNWITPTTTDSWKRRKFVASKDVWHLQLASMDLYCQLTLSEISRQLSQPPSEQNSILEDPPNIWSAHNRQSSRCSLKQISQRTQSQVDCEGLTTRYLVFQPLPLNLRTIGQWCDNGRRWNKGTINLTPTISFGVLNLQPGPRKIGPPRLDFLVVLLMPDEWVSSWNQRKWDRGLHPFCGVEQD